MVNHPNRTRARLARYGARLRTIDGETIVEMIDPNDKARRRFQYRRSDNGLERRVLGSDGMPMMDGSPWEAFAPHELAALYAARGQYHPILNPLGFQ